MRTNRKMEEKKMSMSKNIARLAVTAGLTAALSFGGVMAPVTMAFAADANGSVTIENVEGNTTEFQGYQIFKADVDSGKVANITWANDSVEKAVKAVIEKEDKSYAGKTAQDAADWITNNVTGTNETTRVAPDNIAYKIADAVDGLTPSATTTSKTASGLAHGYWLFVTKADTIGEGEAGTSPIFTVVGSTPVKITEKTGIPTVEKKIVSDADSKEHDAADSQVGQNVTYNLYGTIAENYDKYDEYFYEFSDQISKGLTLQSGAKVYLYSSRDDAKADLAHTNGTGTDITTNFKQVTADAAADGSKTTTWTCKDLKKVDGVNSGSCIVVSYKAQINGGAIVAGTGSNDNTVILKYSNNPMNKDSKGQTPPDTVKDYTYGLRINKVDLGTETKLPNAKFTITTNGDEKNKNAKYVDERGNLNTTEVILTTNSDGVITLTGLDAGVYTVKEVSAPDGYTAVDPFTFEIKPTMTDDDPAAGLTAVTGELKTSQTTKVIAGLNDTSAGKVGDNKLDFKEGTLTNTDDGTFNITVGNTKQVGLPLTGLNGVTFTWIAGGAVLCIGVAHLIRSRKQVEESEQE